MTTTCHNWTICRDSKTYSVLWTLLWILDLLQRAENCGYAVDDRIHGFSVGGHCHQIVNLLVAKGPNHGFLVDVILLSNRRDLWIYLNQHRGKQHIHSTISVPSGGFVGCFLVNPHHIHEFWLLCWAKINVLPLLSTYRLLTVTESRGIRFGQTRSLQLKVRRPLCIVAGAV